MPAPTFPNTNAGCCGAARWKASRCTSNASRAAARCDVRCNDRGTVMAGQRLPVLDAFIADLRAIWLAEPENERRMAKAKPLLERLLLDPALKAHSAAWPSTEGRKNLLLYVDPEHHFAINAVVRVPGRSGSVHDHADAWVLYGVLDGSESLERYERIDDGGRPGYAKVRLASVSTGTQGKVDLV